MRAVLAPPPSRACGAGLFQSRIKGRACCDSRRAQPWRPLPAAIGRVGPAWGSPCCGCRCAAAWRPVRGPLALYDRQKPPAQFPESSDNRETDPERPIRAVLVELAGP